MLHRVEASAASVGLYINPGKTKVLTYNLENGVIQNRYNEIIESVDDFLYLGSWIDATERDVNVRKAKAWGALRPTQT